MNSPGRGFSLRGFFGGCVLAGISRPARAFRLRSDWSSSRNCFRSLRSSNLSLSAGFNFLLLLGDSALDLTVNENRALVASLDGVFTQEAEALGLLTL